MPNGKGKTPEKACKPGSELSAAQAHFSRQLKKLPRVSRIIGPIRGKTHNLLIDRPARDLRRRPRYELAGQALPALRGPIVYLWLARGLPLYVGMSRYGLTRAWQSAPETMDLLRSQGYALYLWPVKDAQEAERLEREIIQRLRPAHNRTGNPGRLPISAKAKRLPGWEESDWTGPHDHGCSTCGTLLEPCQDMGCRRFPNDKLCSPCGKALEAQQPREPFRAPVLDPAMVEAISRLPDWTKSGSA